MMKKTLMGAALCVLFALTVSSAAAQTPAVPAAEPVPATAAVAAPATDTPAKPSEEELKRCQGLLKADFYDFLDNESDQRQIKDAALIAQNKKHVVMAYAAMWLLSLGFIFYLWRRHAALRLQLQELTDRVAGMNGSNKAKG